MRQRAKGLLGVGRLLPALHGGDGFARALLRVTVQRRKLRLRTRGFTLRVLVALARRGQSIEVNLVAGIGQHSLQKFGKIVGIQPIAQRIEDLRAVNVGQRIVAVEPAVKCAQCKRHAVWLTDLTAAEGKAFQTRRQRFAVEAALHERMRGLGQRFADFRKLLRHGVSRKEAEVRLKHAVLYLQGDVLRQPSLQKSARQRRFVGAGEVIGKNFCRVDRLDVLVRAENLRRGHVRKCFLALACFIRDCFLAGRGLLCGKIEVRRAVVVLGQIFLIYVPQNFIDLHMAVEEDSRVGRMVEAAMRSDELLPAQLGNVLGVAAADKAVGGVRVQKPRKLALHQGVHVGKRTLHLAVNDAVVARRFARLEMPALLQENLRLLVDQRVKHRVEVDRHQVEQILFVAAGDGIDRLVPEGQGVEEGLHRALQQRDERLLDRETARAVQDAVLENVEHARVVLGQGLEADGKGAVFVRTVEI